MRTEDTRPDGFMDKRLLVVTPVFPNENNSYFGGIFIKDQIDVLKRSFREIVVIAPVLSSAGLLPEDSFCRDYSYENVRVFFPRSIYIPWPLYRRFNISKIFIDNRHRVVERLIEEQHIEFDLIHAHFLWPSASIGEKLKQRYNVPLVITAHGYDMYEVPFRDPVWRERIVSAAEGADYFITVSRNNLSCFKRLQIDIPAQVIPNGFSADLFYPRDMAECRRALHLPPDKTILLTVGNLVEVKGHRYLVEAMKEVAAQRSDVLCVIVGSGPLESTLKRQIADLGLEDSVMLARGRPHEEIPLWMNACDLFVLPSLKEGNPTVMFECLGCGKPFVGTNVGGVSEIIDSEDLGFICESANVVDLSGKILETSNRKWNYEVIYLSAKKYSWANISGDILRIYSSVIAG